MVPVAASRAYTRTRTSAALCEVESDHELIDAVEGVSLQQDLSSVRNPDGWGCGTDLHIWTSGLPEE